MWIAAVATWNWLINRVIPTRWYVPANLTAAMVAVVVAHMTGHRRSDIGLGSPVSGLRWGVVGGAAAAAGVVAASRLPSTAGLFDDARSESDRLGYETLVRIPLGTVVCEETLFRGVIPAVTGSPAAAAAMFGAWHILPTVSALDINGIDDPLPRRAAVAAGIAVTAAASAPLWWLRRRSGSLLAPMLTHWAVNSTAYALSVRRRRGRLTDAGTLPGHRSEE